MSKRLLPICLALLSQTGLFGQNNEPDMKLKMREADGEWVVLVKSFIWDHLDLYITESKTDSVIQRNIIPPMDSLIIYNLGSGDKLALAENFNKQFDVGYFLGNPETIQPDLDYLYGLPFKKGKTYSVSQGPGGGFSHNNDISRHAIDFNLKIGQQVHAAREGRVIKVENQFKKAGGREFIYKANRIIIRHEDGTHASYVHLDYEGVVVSEGDFVEKGQLIGYSGNTGFTRGPHLHFVVRKARDISIPVSFEGYEGQAIRKGRKYKRK